MLWATTHQNNPMSIDETMIDGMTTTNNELKIKDLLVSDSDEDSELAFELEMQLFSYYTSPTCDLAPIVIKIPPVNMDFESTSIWTYKIGPTSITIIQYSVLRTTFYRFGQTTYPQIYPHS